MSTNKKRQISSGLLTVLLLLSCGAQASSISPEAGSPRIEWTPNGVLINDSIGRSTQKNPKIAGDGDGGHIIVWTDERDGYNDLYAQKIDEGGKLLWEWSGTSICREPKNQSSPQIISDGHGGAVIVWEDYRSDHSNIFAQKITFDGKIAWASGGVAVCTAGAAQLAPKIVSDGAGGAIIAWHDYRSGRGEDIYAQRIDTAGKTAWIKDGVPVSDAGGTQWYPEIISDGSGGAVIAWTDFRSGKGSDIYAQHLDQQGNPLWQADGLPVCFAQENQAYPKLTRDGKGGAIITWDDFRSDKFDIFAQKVDSSGKPLWKLNGVPVSVSDQNDERPEITWMLDGGAIISWISRRGDVTKVLAQRIDPSGKVMWGEKGVGISRASGNQENHKIITSRDGGAIIAWEDARRGLKNIYAQKISEGGLALWDLDGIVLCATEDDSELPELSASENNGVVVVWQDLRAGNLDIYAQGVSSDGSIEWIENGALVNSSLGSVAQQNPMIVLDGKDGHIIVWEDGRSGYSDVYAQKIDSKGKLLWGSEGLKLVGAPGIQKNPQIINTGDNSVVVAWEDNRSRSRWEIYAQKISDSGQLMWQPGGVLASSSSQSKSRLKIIRNGTGGALLVWQEDRGQLRQDIYAQKISRSGSPLWGNEGIAVCQSPSDQINPVLATDSGGGTIIAWVDYRTGTFNSDIYAQKITSTGQPLWLEGGVPVCTAPDSQKSPNIIEDGSGGAIISWSDKGGGGYDIYAQIIDKNGRPKLTIDGIPICQASGTQRNPKMSRNGADGTIIVWSDFRNANWDIYAQRMSGDGSLLWDEGGVPICTAPLTQYSPELVSGSWGTIIAWEDYRNAKSYNIYAQKVDYEGEFLWLRDGVPVCSGPDGERNPKIAPNGGGGAIIAWEDYRAGGFGIYAQKIKVISLE
jgi:hypothetical protein